MSASQDKKRGKNAKGGSMYINDKSNAKNASKNGKKRDLHTILFVVVSFIIVVVFLVLIFFNSGILNKYVVAIDANGHKVTSSELSFYYNYQYDNFLNTYSDYLDYIGLDQTKDLDSQECTFSEGQTWAEYFMSSAISSLSDVYLLCDEADAAGYTISAAEQQDLDSSVSYVVSSAEANGYTANAYLRAVYGKGVNLKLFSNILQKQYLSTSYYNVMYDNFAGEVTEDDINTYYDANIDSYLNISYRSFMVDSGIDTEADDADTQAQKLADAMAKAEEITANIETEDDFIMQAYDNASEENKTAYADDAYTLTSNTRDYLTNTVEGNDYAWLIDASRQVGDVTFVQVDNSYRILMYLGEGRDTSPGAADIIMIKTNVEDTDTAAARAKIDEVVALYEADPTEDNFLSLVSYSDEQGNADGVYTDVASGSLGVDEVDAWLYSEGRAVGDTQVIETDSACYYIYVSGVEEAWHSSIKSTVAATAYDDWHTSVSENFIIAEKPFGQKLVY